MLDEFVGSDTILLGLLRQHGRMTVAQLATKTEVTATAVRQRLTRLMHQKMVERTDEKHGRGRPQHLYSLTSSGRRRSGENFADLAMALWQEICALPEGEARRQLIDRVVIRLAAKYSTDVGGRSALEKMDSIARLMGQRHIPVTVEKNNGLPVLQVQACPYPELAENGSAICEMEESLFSELVGRELKLHQSKSGGGCTCRFESVNGPCSESN